MDFSAWFASAIVLGKVVRRAVIIQFSSTDDIHNIIINSINVRLSVWSEMKNSLCGDHVHPSVTQYQRPNHFLDLHENRYRDIFYKKLFREQEFRENRLSDSDTFRTVLSIFIEGFGWNESPSNSLNNWVSWKSTQWNTHVTYERKWIATSNFHIYCKVWVAFGTTYVHALQLGTKPASWRSVQWKPYFTHRRK